MFIFTGEEMTSAIGENWSNRTKHQQKHLSPSKNLFMSGGDIRRESNTNTIIVKGMII